MRTPSFTTYSALLVALFLSPLLQAQQAPQLPPETLPDLVREEVQQRLTRTEQNTALAEDVRTRTVQLYTEALDALDLAATWRTRTEELAALRESAPQRVADLEERLAAGEIESEAPPPQPDNATLATLTQSLTDAERVLAQARTRLDELNAETTRRAERRRQIPELIAAARQRLTEIQATPALPPETAAELIEARSINLRARAQAARAEIAALNEELASYDARSRLLTLRIDEASVQVDLANQAQTRLQDRVTRTRQAEARRAAEEARERLLEASNAPDAIRTYAEQLAQQNADLAERRTGPDGPLRKRDRAQQKKTELDELLARVKTEFEGVRKREEAVGLNDAVGQLLRRYRANLPSRRAHEAAIRLREQEIGLLQLEQIDFQESRADLANINQIVDDRLEQAGLEPAENRRARSQLGDLLRQLLTTQQTTLEALLGDYQAYLDALLELNIIERELLVQRDAFANFIDERVLWIRSGEALGTSDLQPSYDALKWLVSWHNWRTALDALWRDIRNAIPIWLLAALLTVVLSATRRKLVQRLDEVGAGAAKKSCAEYACTVRAGFLTLVLAVGPSLVFLFLGWRLSSSLYASDFARHVGASLLATGIVLLSIDIIRQVLREHGLGEAHFAWPKSAVASFYRILTVLIPAALPLVFVAIMMESQDEVAWRESLGQLTFIALMIAWAIAGHALANKNSDVSKDVLQVLAGKRREGVRRSFYLLVVVLPLGLALAAAAGYYYTAARLAVRVHASVVLADLVFVGVGFAFRAILIARRKIAIEQSKKRRAELRAAQKKAKEEGKEVSEIEIQEPALDLSQIDVQTKRLTRSVAIIALFTGLWFTWVQFVPALGILDDIIIPGTGGTLENLATLNVPADPTGASADTGETPAQQPSNETMTQTRTGISLADLLLALLIGVLTIVAFRNLPGLLEIALLQRLPLAQGERYAITTVLGYILVVIGIFIAMGTIGVEWSKLQWLVAALGVGIGFGLQEIVANFVSGLIILFEQPIRLGDVVTVGDVSGTVTRIRIRATTVTDWERKELVVPNKEFVTGQLVNWSLTDSILRMTIPVGVSYSSDTDLVRKTLTEVVRANERVLDDPEPQILFMEFADSFLLFEARVFIGNINDRIPVQDELHHAITKAFREKSIEIAFPQRDIHVRSIHSALTVEQTGEPVPAEIEQQ